MKPAVTFLNDEQLVSMQHVREKEDRQRALRQMRQFLFYVLQYAY